MPDRNEAADKLLCLKLSFERRTAAVAAAYAHSTILPLPSRTHARPRQMAIRKNSTHNLLQQLNTSGTIAAVLLTLVLRCEISGSDGDGV